MKWLRLTVSGFKTDSELLLNVEHITGLRPLNFEGHTSIATMNGVIFEVDESFATVVAMIEASGLNS